MRKEYKILLGGFIILGLSFFAFAEAAYPSLPGIEAPGEDTSFPELITYFFGLLLWVSTILVAASLIYGGILYLVSGGNQALISKAKSRATYSAWGLLILLTSFLLLNTINPQIVETPWDEPSATSVEPVEPDLTPPTRATTTFQEIPIGTLTEKLLAKDIDCYRDGDVNNVMTDCQDGKELDTLVNEYEARRGYCYDFKEEDDILKFKDADPDTEQIDPITEHDRFNCLLKLKEPVNEKMDKLKNWSEELKNLLQLNCKCSNCKKEGCDCVSTACPASCSCTDLKCIGHPYKEGDPCSNRESQIDEIRKKIRRNYTDEELKENLTVDDFNERAVDHPDDHSGQGDPLLIADQVRFLMLNFLEPLQKDLENDLAYLRKSENFLDECPYQTITSHAKYFLTKEKGDDVQWGEKKFCETDSPASWDESCDYLDETRITKYCKEFNAPGCKTEEDGKLPCYECDLDELEQGDCATSTIGERKLKTCKPEEYLLNNQFGTSTCTTTDAICTLCKIENENPGEEPEKKCELHDGDPATFYCPDPDSEKVPENEAILFEQGVIDPEPENRYPRGLIPIGHAVDDTQFLGQEILDELKKINEEIEEATDALFDPEDPGKLKDPGPGKDDVLYSLPLGCVCDPSGWNFTITGKCNPVCICMPTTCSIDPPLTTCGTCDDSCKGDPCPTGKINEKVTTVRNAKQTIEKSFSRIRDLVEVQNLEEGDPNRHELITMLSLSRERMQRCMIGFEKVPKEKMAPQGTLSCSLAFELLKLGKANIQPDFPIPNYENCYPPEFPVSEYQDIGSCYPYNSEQLTEDQMETCLENMDSTECRNAVSGIGQTGGMNNFFCYVLAR